MKKLALVATLLIPLSAWAAGPASVKVGNAGDLAELCGANPKDPVGPEKINFCHGFAQGAIDVERKYAGDKKKFCMPSPAPTRTETMTQFVNWVRSLPAHKALGPTEGFFQFLAERFPC